MKNILLLAILFTFLASCDNDKDDCPNADHPMQSYFTSQNSNTEMDNTIGYNTNIHQYSFKINEDGVICSVGYQGTEGVGSYLITIKNSEGAILSENEFDFSFAQREFKGIDDVAIVANEEYTITREALGYTETSLSGGQILKANNVPFGESVLALPQTNEYLQITKVLFTGEVDYPSNAVPFIDFGFEGK